MSERQCDNCGTRYDPEDYRCTRVIVNYQRRHSMTFYYCPDCSAAPVQGATTMHNISTQPIAEQPRRPAPEDLDRFRGR